MKTKTPVDAVTYHKKKHREYKIRRMEALEKAKKDHLRMLIEIIEHDRNNSARAGTNASNGQGYCRMV